MASIRDLRVRIKSVGNIKQITRAMEMVATTKLRRFQDRAVASRPYADEIAQLLSRIATAMGPDLADQAAFRAGRGAAVAVLLVTSERGLAGAYNSNVFQALERWMAANKGVDARFFVYGRKGYQYALKRGFKVERFFVDPPLEKVDYRLAKFTAKALSDAFLSGEYKEVVVLHSAFESMAKYIPTFTTILPVQKSAASADKSAANVILEPDVNTLLERLVPRYLETRIYNALLESITSEYASRRMSMKNATDAASTMQSELKGIYNRKRQEGITKDLLDIVGAAEALR
ncbi:MAG TPA: ATP synthase F1 subunit gamma [Planctomycetota bacterium]|nr:ATP synthase F1 subunit gamma [Planctomycetota bacterium]